MSTPTSTQDALLQATRQQLEELDALIQRMLALPVVEVTEPLLGETAVPEKSAAAAEDFKETPGTNEVLYADAAPEAEAEPCAGPKLDPRVVPIEAPTDVSTTSPEVGLPESKSMDAVAAVVALPPSGETGQADENPEPSFWLQPLVVVNTVFDLGTHLLGPGGRWFRGEQGRTFLGFTGLALLVAAGVLGILDWVLGNW